MGFLFYGRFHTIARMENNIKDDNLRHPNMVLRTLQPTSITDNLLKKVMEKPNIAPERVFHIDEAQTTQHTAKNKFGAILFF